MAHGNFHRNSQAIWASVVPQAPRVLVGTLELERKSTTHSVLVRKAFVVAVRYPSHARRHRIFTEMNFVGLLVLPTPNDKLS